MLNIVIINSFLVGTSVLLLVILIGLRINRLIPEIPLSYEAFASINPTDLIESDLDRKLRQLAEARYAMAATPGQRILTHTVRIRYDSTIPRTFLDVCDDFFLGFHTYAFDKDGKAVGDQFNAYCDEPADGCVESSCREETEVYATQDQLNQLR